MYSPREICQITYTMAISNVFVDLMYIFDIYIFLLTHVYMFLCLTICLFTIIY